jgi:CRP-like cAMP-binding protein
VALNIGNPMISVGETESCAGCLSVALAGIVRGKLCDTLLSNRVPVTFEKDDVLYDQRGRGHTFFFLRSGVVKVGTITVDGHEIIYDVRKAGEVVGELSMCGSMLRSDRAVALERSEVIAVPYTEIVRAVQANPDLLRKLLELFCQSLADAYEQVNRLAVDDVTQRLTKVLVDLASKLGRPSGKAIEIPTYLTQEEISQMVAVRRERVSTALNSLRRQGIIQYSRRGHLVLDVKALEKQAA